MKDHYQELYATFRWWVPQRFNIAEACCRQWTATGAGARRIALYSESTADKREIWTFARVQEYANRLSNGLRRTGVQRGDRVAIALPQRPETLVAHIAVYQLGAISVPLSVHLETEVFEQRLRDSEARIVLVDAAGAGALLPAVDRCPLLRQAIGIDLEDERVLPWRSLIARQESAFDMLPTASSDPAMLLYTEGSTGSPKGVLLPHSALIGNLPGFVASQNWFPEAANVLWTPSDWATAEGLFGALLPCLYFGYPLVSSRQTLAPEGVLDLLDRYKVTHTSFTSGALATLVRAVPSGRSSQLALKAVVATGAPLEPAVLEQCSQVLGVIPNETFSQTEVGTVIGQSHDKWPLRAGSMGRPYPGHRIELVDSHGLAVEQGTAGEIVVNRYDISGHPDPALLLGYWRSEESGRPSGGTWHRTGDMAWADADGYLWYVGRTEDLFTVGTHRMGPEPIEACLKSYPGIANAAVIATPGVEQDTWLKAYVVRDPDDVAQQDDDSLSHALIAHVRAHLPVYQVPQSIEFVNALPMTATGKLRRHVLRHLDAQQSRHRRSAPAQTVPAP